MIVHVQDQSGIPVSGVTINVNTNDARFSIGGTAFIGRDRYGYPTSGPATNTSGDAVVWLFPNGTYNFTASPPSGSSYFPTNLSNIYITSDTQETITLQQPVTLSGHLYDELGNPVPSQKIFLYGSGGGSATTDSSGSYLMQVSPGIFILDIEARNTDFSLNVPQEYVFQASNYSINQNTVLDITLPARKVTIHVQDGLGNPISGVGVSVSGNEAFSIGGSINFRGSQGYGRTAAAPTTDASGNAIFWLFPGGSNTFIASPPSGSSFQTTTLSNVVISGDTNLTLVMQQQVILSGHVYDPLGNPVPNQRLFLNGAGGGGATSDASGNYSMTVAAGIYQLTVDGRTSDPTALNLPQDYFIASDNYSISQNTILDITLPAKKVIVHIQDRSGNPISGVVTNVNTANAARFSIGGITFIGTNRYGYPTSGPATNTSGDAVVWLFPNGTYNFTASPPSGSIYAPFVLSNVVVTSDQTEIISLQFIHDRPVTAATLSPSPNAQGEYSDPTTVTLSATAAQGFTIANSYYTVDGGSQQTYLSPFQVSGEGEHTITFWSIDNVGVFEAPNTQTFIIHINQPADINVIPDATINEGDTYSASGSFADPDSTSWTATVDYGDGSGIQPLTLSGTSFSLSHVYKDNGIYTVTVSVTDNQGAVGTEAATITVNNVTPTVGAITAPADPAQANTAVTASAPFTDLGVLDTHTAVWNWGDGTTNNGTITESNGSGSVSDNHMYTAAGVYTITLTVTDKDGGIGSSTFQYVVVYDPSAGYVTGAGTITSPEGAYIQDSSLSGKAVFGFVSKYQNGANQPTGSTQFRFIIANFSFKSTSYDWLVVGGAKAQYKGSGTVNGSGDYGFILSSIDGELPGGGGTDKFRIKITDKTTGNVIYDNQQGSSDTSDPATVIDSGSITIHN